MIFLLFELPILNNLKSMGSHRSLTPATAATISGGFFSSVKK
jgi:hypothetical protein